jgi:hypothetical protein
VSQVDQFESVFRSALREPFEFDPPSAKSLIVVTDLAQAEADAFAEPIIRFLTSTSLCDTPNVQAIGGDAFSSTAELLDRVDSSGADLICTYRNLHSEAWRFPHSLGEYLDVLLQRASAPVLVLPHPRADFAADHAMQNTEVVMAVTDHLEKDHRLVNYAASLVHPGGTLCLAHIECRQTFDRYLDAISKIPTVDTDDTQRRLEKQLLKDARAYVDSCAARLSQTGLELQVKPLIEFGDHLADYRRYLEAFHVDLLVMNTRDKDQLAMHGLAYPLAVELRQIPLFML